MQQFMMMFMQNLMQGKLNNHPLMGSYRQMMQGKTPQQQADTLLNIARSKGIDVNEKRFSVADIQKVFNNFPQR